MSAEYRLKLVNWLTSMMLLMLMSSLMALHEWFTWLPKTYALNRPFSDQIITLFGAIDFFQWMFLPVALWHFADFVEARTTKIALAAYRNVSALVAALGIAAIFHQSLWLNDLFCPELELPPNVLMFDGCGSWTPLWKTAIFLCLFIALCALAAVKIWFATRSRFQKKG
ncbi:MAG: hypothetical protein COW16_09085 [Sphingomonadales bacterium CG12_big_fil_rev_8_21_14_0_65_65_10]|uniref:hypothetical protein n=1 Tax=Blastomonas marina TaxID=1867408 RepID=UPI000CBFDFDE|nr:hypothetical protein [Blastomonas marina]PIW54851.1 MAG: hypothetical protein COW16_09085 [Sphingomonadales bacterium CG12_big_fil_rev_8_21_14_0_65_65_10]